MGGARCETEFPRLKGECMNASKHPHRGVADPREALVAEIRARRAALAAGAPVPRRFVGPRAMTPRQPPTPPTPPPTPTPDQTPEPPTPTDDVFGAAAAERVYAARQEVVRGISAARISAMDVHTGAGSAVTSPPGPTRSAPRGWPDHETVYAARRRDVERARSARRRE
jgi:hypothetical protein